MGEFGNILRKKRRGFTNKVELALEEIIEEARNFAPRGHTDQLRSGIVSGGVVVTSNMVKGLIISSAISSEGEEYAGEIHDDIKGHASPENSKATISFIDFSEGGDTAEEHYWSGYNIFRPEAPEYATDYLNKGYDEAKPIVIKLLGFTRKGKI